MSRNVSFRKKRAARSRGTLRVEAEAGDLGVGDPGQPALHSETCLQTPKRKKNGYDLRTKEMACS